MFEIWFVLWYYFGFKKKIHLGRVPTGCGEQLTPEKSETENRPHPLGTRPKEGRNKKRKAQNKQQKWLVPNKLLVNPLEARLLANNSPPRLPENLLLPLEVSRSHTDTDLELWPFERFVVTKSPPNF
jgi:hypothetical protein